MVTLKKHHFKGHQSSQITEDIIKPPCLQSQSMHAIALAQIILLVTIQVKCALRAFYH